VQGWLAPVRALVPPVSEGLFAGILDISRVPTLSDRIKFRISVWMGVWKAGDNRDWDANPRLGARTAGQTRSLGDPQKTSTAETQRTRGKALCFVLRPGCFQGTVAVMTRAAGRRGR
jgi:hypothetical protein